KLASGDPTWRSLTALLYHYESQPLPTWAGWFVAHLPLWFQKLSCVVMFAIELGLPFLIFLPRRPKILACAGFLALQFLINLTGNYGFFGLQAAVLSLTLLDDRFWREKFPAVARLKPPEAWLSHFWVPLPLIALVAGVSLFHVSSLSDAIGPYRWVNSYGVFAVMTTERDEILVEGSDDQQNWRPYEFRWKPGDPLKRPGFTGTHMPRLDWQMWFAALGSIRQNPWFLNFMQRLLEGSKPVLGLLAENPFPEHPPKFLRARLFRYRFSDLSRPQGAWWTREELGAYSPVLSLGPRS
ncbi:MAG: lipase maturation factor family protein, partial [Bdellovibrionota bacterium]